MTLNERIQKVAFQHLLETHQAVPVEALTDELGGPREGIEKGVAELDRRGLIRTNQGGDIVGSVGLSIEPSRHELFVRGRQFWTWCAYDAIGILAALGSGGRVRSKSPLTGAPIEVHFDDGSPERSKVVLFLPDFFASPSKGTPAPEPGVSVFDDWCPQSNLFENRAASRTWVERHGVPGQILSLTEAAALGARHWQPIVPPALVSTTDPGL